MTLIKKSDVKNHLSTRSNAIVFPFRPASQPDATGNSGDDVTDGDRHFLDSLHHSKEKAPQTRPVDFSQGRDGADETTKPQA